MRDELAEADRQDALVRAHKYGPRPLEHVPDRDLVANIARWRQAQDDAAKWQQDAESTKDRCPFTTKAKREVAEQRAGAWQAKVRADASARNREVAKLAQQIRVKEQQLAAAKGPFKGGQRRAIADEITALQAAQEAVAVTSGTGAAGAGAGDGADYRGDPAVEARAAAKLALAQQQDEAAVQHSELRAGRYAEAAEAVREQLPVAEAELALRAEHPELTVEVPPEQLAREAAAQQEQARQRAAAQARERTHIQQAPSVDHGISM
jgi:hypothetical protein